MSGIMNYDPGFVSSGNRAKKVIELTFAEYDYRLTVSVEVTGNIRGLDSIRSALEDYFCAQEPIEGFEESNEGIDMVLSHENGDTLEGVYTFEEIESMLIKAEIVSYEPIPEPEE